MNVPVVIAVLASLLGGLSVCVKKNWSFHSLYAMASVGGGFLLAMTLLELLPRSAVGRWQMVPFVLCGFMLVFVVESLCHNRKQMDQTNLSGVLLAFLIHAYIEGVSLAASFQVDTTLGVSFLLGMIMHKYPDGVTLTSLMLAVTKNRALSFAAAAALGASTLLGAVTFGQTGERLSPQAVQLVLSLAAGVFLYVSTSHLVPVVRESGSLTLRVYFCAGALCYLLLWLFIHLAVPHV